MNLSIKNESISCLILYFNSSLSPALEIYQPSWLQLFFYIMDCSFLAPPKALYNDLPFTHSHKHSHTSGGCGYARRCPTPWLASSCPTPPPSIGSSKPPVWLSSKQSKNSTHVFFRVQLKPNQPRHESVCWKPPVKNDLNTQKERKNMKEEEEGEEEDIEEVPGSNMNTLLQW